MTEARGVNVRPAGAPMVSMPRTGDDRTQNGSDGSGGLSAHASEITDAARRAGGDLRKEAGREIDRRSTMAGERVAEAAGDMRRVAGMLREEGRDAPARMVDGVAERVDRMADYLATADTQRMMDDIGGFARRRPAMVVGGAVLLGLAVGRIVKAADTGSGAREGVRA